MPHLNAVSRLSPSSFIIKSCCGSFSRPRCGSDNGGDYKNGRKYKFRGGRSKLKYSPGALRCATLNSSKLSDDGRGGERPETGEAIVEAQIVEGEKEVWQASNFALCAHTFDGWHC